MSFNLVGEETVDQEGDLIVKLSSGETGIVDDGSSPPLSAKYEGNESFTLGIRDGQSSASIVIGGSRNTFDGTNINTVSNATGGIIIGNDNTLTGNGFDTFSTFASIIGWGNKIEGIASISIGGYNDDSTPNTVNSDYSASIGHGNEINTDAPTYVFGASTVVESSAVDDHTSIGRYNTIGSNAEQVNMLGDNLEWGTGSGDDEHRITILGRWNVDLTTSGIRNLPLLVGGGDPGARYNSFLIEDRGTSAPFTSVANIHNIHLNNNVVDSDWTGVSKGNIISRDSSIESGGNPSLSNSILSGETFFGTNLVSVSDSFIGNSDLLAENQVSESIIADTIIEEGSQNNVIKNAVLLSCTITSSNEDKFSDSSSGGTKVAFSFNNDTFIAYHSSASFSDRDGSVIIAGGGSGYINDVKNSVSIGGASVGSPNTVGIGTNTFIEGDVDIYPSTSQPGSSSDPAIAIGNSGAGFYIDSNGDVVVVDEAGNTTVIS